ncbi:MAG: hypothetical protein IJT16_15065 [Lachnospiraceae bacterium]|nr:hypothetical protein [Lachnospiraceae bacterium]
MGNESEGASLKTKELVNLAVMLIMFVGYSLTFMIPKFYGATDAYVGVFVFVCLAILLFCNADPVSLLRKKDRDFLILSVVLVITLINLFIVRSGLGAFFVAADFLLIFFLSGHIRLSRRSIRILSGCYMALLVVWFFIAYPRLFADYAFYGYNTNTAATFTIYTLLCAFIFAELLYEQGNGGTLSVLAGLLMTILMVKGFQLALWHRARGAFIMLSVFVVFWFLVPKGWWRKKGFYRAAWILATFGSLAFVSLYVIVGATGVNFRLPFFYKDVFSGRDKIWYEFFTLFCRKPLTGIGTNVTIESFFEFNVHNAMYNFLVIDGIIVFAGILYMIFRFAGRAYLAIALKESRSDSDIQDEPSRPVSGSRKAPPQTAEGSRLPLLALVILLSVFFESYFDVDLIWADYALNLLFLCSTVMVHMREVKP